MRHVNPNAIQPVLDGIALAEAQPSADLFAEMTHVLETEELRHTGRFLPAKRIAFAEGYVAAVRSADL